MVYKSMLCEEGFNIVLFNLNDADVVSCALYRTASIGFDFQPLGIEYIVQDENDAKGKAPE